MMEQARTMADAPARLALREQLAAFHCQVHQPDDPPLFSREPALRMRSHHWKRDELEPLLQKLGDSIDLGAGGPRRTLRLVSPGLARGTTPTFWASLQVILPGEVADAHRHSANAFRFVMRGSGATTTVDGTRCPMHTGDLVLTPAWRWHDHEHHGDAPMVWLDVLDIPLMDGLHATFFEPHAERVQGIDAQALPAAAPDNPMGRPGIDVHAPAENPLLAYPAGMARAALAQAALQPRDCFDDVILEYQNPANRASALPTLSMTLQALGAGFVGKARRTTGSRLYYVVKGAGTSRAGSESFAWSQGDFFTIAPWTWFSHQVAVDAGDALLFQVNDLPVMRALGFLREEQAP